MDREQGQSDRRKWTGRDVLVQPKTGPKTDKQRQKHKEETKVDDLNRVNKNKDKWMEGKGQGEKQVQ